MVIIHGSQFAPAMYAVFNDRFDAPIGHAFAGQSNPPNRCLVRQSRRVPARIDQGKTTDGYAALPRQYASTHARSSEGPPLPVDRKESTAHQNKIREGGPIAGNRPLIVKPTVAD